MIVSEARLVGPRHIAVKAIHTPIAAALSLIHGCGVQYAKGIPVDPSARNKQVNACLILCRPAPSFFQ